MRKQAITAQIRQHSYNGYKENGMNKVGTRQIETERLLLRRFVIEDAEDMYSGWCNDPEVSKYLTWPPHESADVTRYLLNTWIPEYEKGEYFNWVMELKETGKIIGNISVVQVREDIGEALPRHGPEAIYIPGDEFHTL